MNSPYPDVIDVILQDVPVGSTPQVNLQLINGSSAVGFVHASDPGVVTIAPSADDPQIKHYIYISRGAIVAARVLSY